MLFLYTAPKSQKILSSEKWIIVGFVKNISFHLLGGTVIGLFEVKCFNFNRILWRASESYQILKKWLIW